MSPLTFCRTFLLGSALLLAKGYGQPHQEAKCFRGGCYEEDFSNQEYPLLVFISFSMPEEALLLFGAELKIYGGVFVIRGLPKNSLAKFLKKVNRLKEQGLDASFLIDPESFEAFEVTEVPTILLKSEGSFDKITGNVPISYALETFAKEGETAPLANELFYHTSKQSLQSIGEYK